MGPSIVLGVLGSKWSTELDKTCLIEVSVDHRQETRCVFYVRVFGVRVSENVADACASGFIAFTTDQTHIHHRIPTPTQPQPQRTRNGNVPAACRHVRDDVGDKGVAVDDRRCVCLGCLCVCVGLNDIHTYSHGPPENHTTPQDTHRRPSLGTGSRRPHRTRFASRRAPSGTGTRPVCVLGEGGECFSSLVLCLCFGVVGGCGVGGPSPHPVDRRPDARTHKIRRIQDQTFKQTPTHRGARADEDRDAQKGDELAGRPRGLGDAFVLVCRWVDQSVPWPPPTRHFIDQLTTNTDTKHTRTQNRHAPVLTITPPPSDTTAPTPAPANNATAVLRLTPVRIMMPPPQKMPLLGGGGGGGGLRRRGCLICLRC